METIKAKSKLNAQDEIYFNQMKNMLAENAIFEEKYPRQSAYSLTLRGKGHTL